MHTAAIPAVLPPLGKSRLERALSLFTDLRAGEGVTAMLMLLNILVLLICYSVIKTVREPLILLGGGAEVRSYAAAGQAVLLMGFVPLYGWFVSRVDRAKLLVGVTLFFVVCIELFAAAVAAHVAFVGVAFFIWVGIFNMSLVAQFWSFASDIYSKEAGDRLFPVIMIGMTAGAPIGSFVSGRLFGLGVAPQSILQISALLLLASVGLYLLINRRETRHTAAPKEAGISSRGGFRLVLGNRYLQLIAALVVLLNIVNTTGEYLIARLLTGHVNALALADPAFNKQAFIGAYMGEYQFWVNIAALVLQAFVTARLVKYRGLRGILLVLPLIALGGYAIVAAGVGFSIVRWIKTAENATDYSIMNTARQLLWLPATREEKYKAKQAIDTFFVRGGDLLSAGVVFIGTSVLHLSVQQFAIGNIFLTIAWIGVALLILAPARTAGRVWTRRLATAAAVTLALVAVPSPSAAQETREAQLDAARAEKAKHLRPYQPEPLERQILRVESMFLSQRPVYSYIGSIFPGGGLAAGPGFRGRFGDTGTFDAHAGWSLRNYKTAAAKVKWPVMAGHRLSVEMHANWLDAPKVASYGVGTDSDGTRTNLAYRTTTAGLSARFQAAAVLAAGGGLDALAIKSAADASPTYRRSRVFADLDWRTSADRTRHGGQSRLEWTDYRQTNGSGRSFRRIDAEVNQFIPLLRDNWVIALRAMASSTTTTAGNDVPYFLMPDLGGSHTLRGYSTFRFRDRQRLLFTGEYRWTAGPFVDMAVFLDAGKVAARFRQLDLHDMKTSYGLGMSLHTLNRTMLRIELARSREGSALSFSFSPSF